MSKPPIWAVFLSLEKMRELVVSDALASGQSVNVTQCLGLILDFSHFMNYNICMSLRLVRSSSRTKCHGDTMSNLANHGDCVMPKNSKPVVQTGEMLEMFNAQEVAVLTASTTAYADADDDQNEAVREIAKVLGAKPSWARYEAGRIRIVAVLKQIGKSDEAIKSVWRRMRANLGITIPTSDNPESQKKAEQRAKKAEEARKVFAGKTDSELNTEIKTLLANPTVANITQAGKVQKEIELRYNLANKEQIEAEKQLRENLRDWLKTASYAEMQDIWHRVAK